MSILDNELVKKYFTPEHKAYYPCKQMDAAAWDKCAMAAHVLSAMQEPIRTGDKYLGIYFGNNEELEIIEQDFLDENQGLKPFHGFSLRLPDKFQKRECEMLLTCPICHLSCDGKWLWHGNGYNIEMCSVCKEVIKPEGGNYWRAERYQPQRDEVGVEDRQVEEKIREVIWSVTEHGNMALEGQLRELVRLARGEK